MSLFCLVYRIIHLNSPLFGRLSGNASGSGRLPMGCVKHSSKMKLTIKIGSQFLLVPQRLRRQGSHR